MARSPAPPGVHDSRYTRKVRIWDLPTRVFHWSLATIVSGAIATAELGGNWMAWHIRLGGIALALLAFRFIWGFIGSRYARFNSFLYSPKTVWAYFQPAPGASPKHYAGHNPAGSLSVFAILLTLLLQVGTGLFSSDSISVEGPLAWHLSDEHVSLATTIHDAMVWPLCTLIGLHISAVFFYLLSKKEDLIGPMITGDKQLLNERPAADTWPARVAGLSLLFACITASLWLIR